MTEISNANSVFELAFSANLVLTVIAGRLRASRESVAQHLASQIMLHDPTFQLDQAEQVAFVKLAYSASNGLRFAHYAAIVPMIMSITITSLAVAALIVSATRPKLLVPDAWVIWFAIGSLVLAPLSYGAFGWVVDKIRRAMLTRIELDPSEANLWADLFRSTQHFAATMSETNQMVAASRRLIWSARWTSRWYKIKFVPLDLRIRYHGLRRRLRKRRSQ